MAMSCRAFCSSCCATNQTQSNRGIAGTLLFQQCHLSFIVSGQNSDPKQNFLRLSTYILCCGNCSASCEWLHSKNLAALVMLEQVWLLANAIKWYCCLMRGTLVFALLLQIFLWTFCMLEKIFWKSCQKDSLE